MADVKWIKLTTDMFDNRKIKHLRRLPDGNNIVLLWIMLLTMAGRCNAGGMIFLTENIPYTTKMLADELGFEENTVILGIEVLDQLNMIVAKDGFFSIAGWGEYQNLDGLETIREQNRLRKQKQREKERPLGDMSRDCHVTSHVTVTECHATDIEEEKEKEEDKEISNSTPTAPKKHKHGEHKNVLLTDEEYTKLQQKFPTDYEDKINALSEGLALKGYKYKSHYLAILKWAKNDEQKAKPTASSNPFLDLLKEG